MLPCLVSLFSLIAPSLSTQVFRAWYQCQAPPQHWRRRDKTSSPCPQADLGCGRMLQGPRGAHQSAQHKRLLGGHKSAARIGVPGGGA